MKKLRKFLAGSLVVLVATALAMPLQVTVSGCDSEMPDCPQECCGGGPPVDDSVYCGDCECRSGGGGGGGGGCGEVCGGGGVCSGADLTFECQAARELCGC